MRAAEIDHSLAHVVRGSFILATGVDFGASVIVGIGVGVVTGVGVGFAVDCAVAGTGVGVETKRV
jgi:hypothetical protein